MEPLRAGGGDISLAISPDGSRLVYVAGQTDQLMVRVIDQVDAVPLRGSMGRFLFFSPDGKW